VSTPSAQAADGCAAVRAAHDEPLVATAPERASSWLLVEHPGPWPPDGLPEDLPADAAAVLDAATEAGIRPQLVRRVTTRRRDAFTVIAASCRPGIRWTVRRTLTDLRDLVELDLAALSEGTPPRFGTLAADPLVLVCTHGRRDVCCARLGRPLAVLLDAQLPGLVWETTHVGGDRFAPNVVALPDGSYHGGVTATDVPALAAALRSRQVLLPRLRGWAGMASAAQAADHFLRQHTGVRDLDGVHVVTCTPAPSGGACVEALVGETRWCVHVTSRPAVSERLTSCAGGGTYASPVAFELVSMRRHA
jgi:hypothetical protein